MSAGGGRKLVRLYLHEKTGVRPQSRQGWNCGCMLSDGSEIVRASKLRWPYREAGLSAMMVLVLIPFALGGVAFGVELTRCQVSQVELQQEADDAALLGATLLPHEDVAREALRQHFAKRHDVDYALTISGGRIAKVSVRRRVENPVLGLFSKKEWVVEAEASAGKVAQDMVLVLPDGQTMRPGLRKNLSGEVLGPEATFGNWPKAQYFELSSPAVSQREPIGHWKWWREWRQGYASWATQACYNPIYSPIKMAAISIIDTLRAAEGNRLGVLFSPGERDDGGVAVLRGLSRRDLRGYPGGFWEGDRGESRWIATGGYYKDGLTHDSCVIFSSPFAGGEDPAFSLSHPPLLPVNGAREDSEHCRFPVRGDYLGQALSLSYAVNECYMSRHLQLREAVYWHAAHLNEEGFLAQFNLAAAWREALTQFILVQEDSERQDAKSRRGNLAAISSKTIIVIDDQFIGANEQELAELLRQSSQLGIMVVFVGVQHEFLGKRELALLDNNLRQLRDLIGDRSISFGVATKKDKPSFVVIEAKSPNELVTSIVPRLITMGQRVSLIR